MQPTPVNVTRNPNTSDFVAIESTLNERASVGSVNDVCSKEMAKRAQVSQQAAALTPYLGNMYTNQVMRCQTMANEGNICSGSNASSTNNTPCPQGTNDQLQDCITNGMSTLMADKLEACRYGQFNHLLYKGGTGENEQNGNQNLEAGRDTCSAFLGKIEADNAAAAAVMSHGYDGWTATAASWGKSGN